MTHFWNKHISWLIREFRKNSREFYVYIAKRADIFCTRDQCLSISDYISNKYRLVRLAYLVGESLYQDGHQQIEKDVVAKRHQGNKVESSPVAGALHAQKEDDIPILLCEDLHKNVP